MEKKGDKYNRLGPRYPGIRISEEEVQDRRKVFHQEQDLYTAKPGSSYNEGNGNAYAECGK